jgi:hypothetical protein
MKFNVTVWCDAHRSAIDAADTHRWRVITTATAGAAGLVCWVAAAVGSRRGGAAAQGTPLRSAQRRADLHQVNLKSSSKALKPGCAAQQICHERSAARA